MERGILLLWRENNELLYLGILLQAHANKKEVLIEAHILQRWRALSRGSKLQETHLDVWSYTRGGACSCNPQGSGEANAAEKTGNAGCASECHHPGMQQGHSSEVLTPGVCCCPDNREIRVMFQVPHKSGFALCWTAWRQSHCVFGKLMLKFTFQEQILVTCCC